MKKRIWNLFFVFLVAVACLRLFTPAASAEESKKLTLTVGAYQNSPKIYKDSQGKAAGFYKDLLEYISTKENWEINYLWGSWEESLERLAAKRIDIMPDVAISDEREKLYIFNKESVLSNWARLYAAPGENADDFLDLKNKKVVVMVGSIHTDGESGIKNLMRRFDISCSFIEVTNYKEVFELLDKKKADFGIVNRTFGNANEKKFKVRRTPVMFNPADLRFAFPPGAKLNSRLIKRIDYHMGELKENSDSIYYALLDKHFGIAMEKMPLPVWVMDVMYALLALLLVAGAGIFLCRRTVRQKTKELSQAHREVIDRLGNALEYRDTCTGRHINMVSEIAYSIAKEIGLSNDKCELLRKAATMHDVGKIAIGDDILLKPDKLTTEEFEIIKEHTTLGADMLAEGKSEIIKMAETIALYHHERWDGQGYPRGLREKQIPLVARICKVADVFDALISERPYKKPWPIKEAVNEIIIRKGTHFDPKIVSAFIKILPNLIKKFNLKKAPAEFDKNGKWGRF